MKKLLPLLCLFVATLAWGFDPSNPCALTSKPTLYKDLLAAQKVDCNPWPMDGALSDLSTAPRLVTNVNGTVVWWHCKIVSGKSWTWKAQVFVGTKEYIAAQGKQFAASINAHLQLALNSPQGIDGLAAEFVTLPINDPTIAAVWCPVWGTINSTKPANGKLP